MHETSIIVCALSDDELALGDSICQMTKCKITFYYLHHSYRFKCSKPSRQQTADTWAI